MKTFLATAAASLILCCVSSTRVSASIEFAVVNDSIKLLNGAGGNGGIFYVDVLGAGNVSSTLPYNGSSPYYDFPTFCVEIGEHVTLGDTYKVASITTASMETGYDLGSFAAWLYTQFLGPTLSGNPLLPGIGSFAHWGGNPDQDANAIQYGIWKSMGYTLAEINGALSGGYDSLLLSELHAAYIADDWSYGSVDPNTMNAGTYIGNARIMNLTTLGDKKAQDQLVWVPGTFNPPPPEGSMPEPMSFFVWSMLALCAGSAGIRSRNS